MRLDVTSRLAAFGLDPAGPAERAARPRRELQHRASRALPNIVNNSMRSRSDRPALEQIERGQVVVAEESTGSPALRCVIDRIGGTMGCSSSPSCGFGA